MDAMVQQIESPFTAGVLHFPLPAKFRMPQIETFNGTKDPIDHLNTYKNIMELHGYQDPIRCRAFAITLKGPTLAWFNKLPSSSNSSFTELSIAFVSQFIGARTYRKPSYHSDHKVELARELEVICPEIQRRVVKGGYSRRKFCHYRFHHRARGAVKRPNVLYLKEPLSEHGRGACQNREVYQR